MKSLSNCGELHLNTVHFESPSHTGNLLSGLNALHNKGLLLDVTLVAGGQQFRAHRVVLASCSEYFRAMFTDALRESQLSEICLKGVSAEGLRYLLEYVYTSRLSINLANIQDILATANHVQLFPVVEACSHYLQEQLDLENCVDIATIAETYCLHPLRKRVYQFMCQSLCHFSRVPDFQRLSLYQLEHLLKCDFPVDCDETEVLGIVIRWLEFSPERMPFARQLLASIHFEEIPSPRIVEFLESQLFQAIFTCMIQFHPGENKSLLPSFQMYINENPCCSSATLLNSRGMELAIVKVGGFGLGGITNEITYLLPSVGKWCHLTSIPHVEQCNYGTAVLNNALYVIGGCFNQSLQENIHPFGFRFNPIDNRWATISPMQQERCRFCLCVVDGELYAIGGVGEGGEEGNAVLEESPCEKYDPDADMWLVIASLPRRRTQHAGVTWGSYLYVSGGLDQDFVLNSVECYDPVLDRWKSHAPMILPRADHCMVAHKDKLYVCGGWYEDETNGNRVIVETVDVYNILTNTWEVLTRMPTPRYHAGAVVIEDKLYITGGFHSDVMFDRATGVIECYSFQDDTWTTIQSYPQDIWEHCCVTLYIPKCRDDMEVVADVS